MIEILLADDHAMVRASLRALLDRQPDLRVIAEALFLLLPYALFLPRLLGKLSVVGSRSSVQLRTDN